MCAVSYNLGLWRGAHRRPGVVRLAPHVDLASYCAGYEYGLQNARAIRAGALSAGTLG